METVRILKRVPLGRSGLEASPLAIGTGTHGWSGSSAQTRKGPGWLVRLLREGLELGIDFWDLADQLLAAQLQFQDCQEIHSEINRKT